ncbi:MAG: hypothetical protein H6741_26360, partial [Alphaproteobacteria bacterium]|nr:hypothetical protein [Alphaproteobacteria bacterium]
RALDWSWELLSPPERLALAELSVFEGGFNLAAAEEVLALDALEATAWVPDVIDGLASHSLLQPGHELGRWRLLRTVQAYAAAKLVDPAAVPGFTGPEAARQTQARHAERYLRPLLDAHAYYMERLPADPERDRLRAELDNIQAALSYARGTLPPEGVVEVLRGASVLLWAWGLHSEVLRLSAGVEDGPLIVLRANALWELGRADASLRQLSERLAIEEDPTARGLLLMTQGTLLREQGHPRQALAACEQATDLLDAAGLRKRAMQSLSVRGLLLADLAEVEEALRTLRAAAKLAAGLNPSTEYVTVLTNLGVVEHGFGRLASAERRFRIALELATRPVERMLLQLDLAALLLDRGERTEAEALYRAIIEAAEPLGAPRLGALAEGNLGELLLCYGEPAAGLPHLRRATSRLRASASWRYLSWFLMRLGEVRIALGDLQGAALDVEESLEVLGEVQDVRIRAELAATQGLLAAALGDPGGGLTLSQQATAALQARQEPLPLARARVLEAEVLRLAGAHAAAGATLDRVRAAAREMGLAANAPVTRMERVVRQALRAGQPGLSPIWGGVGG